MDACNLDNYDDEDRLNPKANNELKKAILNCRAVMIPKIYKE